MMAKRINQESFDDVVKENMGEFGMEAQEAIDDAVQQFESQGVNLANIVKDASLFGENGEKVEHPVITAINQLKISVDNSDKGEIIQILKKLKSECDVDLAKRCMAGNNDAYTVLLNAAIKHKNDNELLKEILSGLISLTNGQPDVLDEAGCSFLVENLTTKADDKDLLVTNLKLIRNTCIKHESNRQLYVKKKMITELVNILIEKKKEPAVVIEACGLLRCLTYDDDVRVPFGSAHEHAKMIVTEGNCLKMLLELSQEYSDNTSVLKELFSTMSVVVVRDEFCKAVMDMGGLDFILKALQNNLGEKGIVKQALGLVKALAGNDDVKVAAVSKGGIELILAAMTKHQANAAVADLGCGTITRVVLRNPANCAKVIECQGHQVILQAMKIHVKEELVQKQACMAIRNLVARTREYCEPILELGAEALINTAKTNHKSCTDEAKAALRDLGCQVCLVWSWRVWSVCLP
ncbi:Hypothetical predicted protein, partial [Mytilus galloprovincialis]